MLIFNYLITEKNNALCWLMALHGALWPGVSLKATVALLHDGGRRRCLAPFTFRKKCQNGTVDRSIVLCSFCSKEFLYHLRTSSLNYHLNTKNLAANLEVQASTASDASASSQPCQATLNQEFKLSQSTCDRLTNSLIKWTVDHFRRQRTGGQLYPNSSSFTTTYLPKFI